MSPRSVQGVLVVVGVCVVAFFVLIVPLGLALDALQAPVREACEARGGVLVHGNCVAAPKCPEVKHVPR